MSVCGVCAWCVCVVWVHGVGVCCVCVCVCVWVRDCVCECVHVSVWVWTSGERVAVGGPANNKHWSSLLSFSVRPSITVCVCCFDDWVGKQVRVGLCFCWDLLSTKCIQTSSSKEEKSIRKHTWVSMRVMRSSIVESSTSSTVRKTQQQLNRHQLHDSYLKAKSQNNLYIISAHNRPLPSAAR